MIVKEQIKEKNLLPGRHSLAFLWPILRWSLTSILNPVERGLRIMKRSSLLFVNPSHMPFQQIVEAPRRQTIIPDAQSRLTKVHHIGVRVTFWSHRCSQPIYLIRCLFRCRLPLTCIRLSLFGWITGLLGLGRFGKFLRFIGGLLCGFLIGFIGLFEFLLLVCSVFLRSDFFGGGLRAGDRIGFRGVYRGGRVIRAGGSGS